MKGFIELHWMEEPLMIRASAITCVSPSDRKGCTEVYLEGAEGPFNVNESYERVLHLMQGGDVMAKGIGFDPDCDYLYDPQQSRVCGFCERCGGEIYKAGERLCSDCREE